MCLFAKLRAFLTHQNDAAPCTHRRVLGGWRHFDSVEPGVLTEFAGENATMQAVLRQLDVTQRASALAPLNLWAIITVLVFGTILLVLVYFGIAALRV